MGCVPGIGQESSADPFVAEQRWGGFLPELWARVVLQQLFDAGHPMQ
jgi:hypothetical protein